MPLREILGLAPPMRTIGRQACFGSDVDFFDSCSDFFISLSTSEEEPSRG
jgi:hypothetical protein